MVFSDCDGQKGGFRVADLLWILTFTVIACAFFVPGYYSSGDAVTAIPKIDASLARLRSALREYRDSPEKGKGSWPETLSVLAADMDGGKLPATPAEAGFTASNNEVRIITDDRPLSDTDFNSTGGWIYNSATGELRANIRRDAWGENTDWLRK